VRLLSVNKCYRELDNCSKKWIFPKTIERCAKCEACTKKCVEIVRAPYKWKQPKNLYITRIRYALSSKKFLIDIGEESEDFARDDCT